MRRGGKLSYLKDDDNLNEENRPTEKAQRAPFSTDPDFFQRPSPAVSLVIVTMLFYLLPAIAFWPQYLPGDEIASKSKIID